MCIFIQYTRIHIQHCAYGYVCLWSPKNIGTVETLTNLLEYACIHAVIYVCT